MKTIIGCSIIILLTYSIQAQKLYVDGTSWFQGDNTPLPPSVGTGVAIGFGSGSTGGYIFSWDYASFTPRNLWLQSPGGSVLIGHTSSSVYGKLDIRSAGTSIYANSTAGNAIYANSSSSQAAIYAYGQEGNAIYASGKNLGMNASGETGGSLSTGEYVGAQGNATGMDVNRQGIRGEINTNSAGGYAGLFVGGTTWVVGTLLKNAGAFIIDHPLEPQTKFLQHSFVESPDMKNIYDGVVTTDKNGRAEIELPKWFQALNTDYRYQLTCINDYAEAYVSRQISDNKFEVTTSKPSIKISWQVTGIRNDPYARDHRIEVEKDKSLPDTGKYIYPKGYQKSDIACLTILSPQGVASLKNREPIRNTK